MKISNLCRTWLFTILLLNQGCSSSIENAALGIGLLAVTPTNEIEQIYYMGMFDL